MSLSFVLASLENHLLNQLLIKKNCQLKILFYRGHLKDPNTKKYFNVFTNHKRSYTVEILAPKDPEIQYNITEAILKKLLKDSLVEMKGPKNQITFGQKIENNETKYSSTVYYSSDTQAVLKIQILMTVLRLLI